MTESVAAGARPVRCAIYTRKSTEEGLEQAFNTLQAQREAAEAYILSQRQGGWLAIPSPYDDGGFSGASMERPALQRLLGDIDAGLIDCVIVYKVDRLSRSLLDFARLMERFDRRGISFVSVTQEFNTTTSLGRLTLNILLSFAQFEREIISERTRDKLSAARRKGKFTGGWPVLGYDVHPQGGRLVVNGREAQQVREIFQIAAESESLEGARRAVHQRGLRTKVWKSGKGRQHGERPFSRMTLRLLLSNVIYIGAVNHKGMVYPGEHERLIEQELWERVNTKLALRSASLRGRPHRRQEAPLAALLCCAGCGSAMALTYTTNHGRKYRYYGCRNRNQGCAWQHVAAVDLEASIRKSLEPVLGSNLDWAMVQTAVQSIRYQGPSRQVTILFRDGTRQEYALVLPNRRGMRNCGNEPENRRVPRVSRLMALAIRFERQIREGEIRNHRDIAQAGRISRARLSQIMSLTDLAPSIQEELLFLPKTVTGSDRITEKAMRQVARAVDWEQQKEAFSDLKVR